MHDHRKCESLEHHESTRWGQGRATREQSVEANNTNQFIHSLVEQPMTFELTNNKLDINGNS